MDWRKLRPSWFFLGNEDESQLDLNVRLTRKWEVGTVKHSLKEPSIHYEIQKDTQPSIRTLGLRHESSLGLFTRWITNESSYQILL